MTASAAMLACDLIATIGNDEDDEWHSLQHLGGRQEAEGTHFDY